MLSLEDWGPIGTQQIVVAAAQDSSNVSTLVDSVSVESGGLGTYRHTADCCCCCTRLI